MLWDGNRCNFTSSPNSDIKGLSVSEVMRIENMITPVKLDNEREFLF